MKTKKIFLFTLLGFVLSLASPALADETAAEGGLTEWSLLNPLPQENTLIAVTYGNGHYVAVGGNGTILTSPAGVEWTRRDSTTSVELYDVTWTGSEFFAVGDSETILSSSDGETWSEVNSEPKGRRLRGISQVDDGVIAVGDRGTMLASEDGVIWEPRESGTTLDLYALALNDEGLVAVGRRGALITSADGETWVSRDAGIPSQSSLLSVVWDGSRFVVGGSGGIIVTSNDGVEWMEQESGISGNVSDLIWTGAEYVGIGMGAAFTSTDAETWETWDPDSPNHFHFWGVAGNGATRVAVGNFGTIVTSQTGEGWFERDSGVTEHLNAVTWTGDRFIAVGNTGTILSSVTGAEWETHDSGTTRALHSVAGSGSRFVAVGTNGRVFFSDDATIWEEHAVTGASHLNAILWNGDTFIAAGHLGRVVSSENGESWTLHDTGSSGNLRGIAWNGQRALAVGNNGLVLASGPAELGIEAPAESESIIVWNRTIGAARTGQGAFVSTLLAADPEGETFTFALVPGEGDDDNASFQVDGNELQTAETLPPDEYSVRLRATNGGGSQIEQSVRITVVPGMVATQITTGNNHTVLLASDGTVFTFGRNSSGQLGHGDEEERTVPTPIEHAALSGHKITAIAAGGWHTVLLSADGTVFTFGLGWRGTEERGGQLGHGDTQNRNVPTPIVDDALSGHVIVGIAAGDAHTILLSSDGTVFTCGYSGDGALGHGETSFADRLVPTPIEHDNLAGRTITRVGAGPQHSVLLSSDGEVVTFGRGSSGQLGRTGSWSNPIPIDHENLDGHVIKGIAGGREHTILVSADGTIFTFGREVWGHLGHGDTESRDVPTPIEWEGLSGYLITRVAAGMQMSALLSDGGTVFTFGSRNGGQLGQGDSRNLNRPTSIAHENLSGKRITAISSGTAHTALLSADGTVFTFGDGGFGPLGHGDTETLWVPIPIEDFSLLPVETPPDGERENFDSAMTDAGLAGEDAEPGATPFGDGVANLLKYAFNMDLAGPDSRRLESGAGGDAGLPAIELDDSGDEPAIVIEFLRRRESGLVYTPKFSSDLGDWTAANGGETVEPIDDEWERVTVEQPVDPAEADRMFGRVEVELP